MLKILKDFFYKPSVEDLYSAYMNLSDKERLEGTTTRKPRYRFSIADIKSGKMRKTR